MGPKYSAAEDLRTLTQRRLLFYNEPCWHKRIIVRGIGLSSISKRIPNTAVFLLFLLGTGLISAGWGFNSAIPASAGTEISFADRTSQAGFTIWENDDIGGWHGTYVADFNDDGFEDLFMTSHGIEKIDDTGKNALFLNNGDGTFTNIAAQAGLDGGWHGRFTRELHGASWFDFDHDGDLDIYFPNTDSVPGDNDHGYDEVYRNDGGGKFTNVSSQLGLPRQDWSRRGGLATDVEGDGDLDLIFVNAADSDKNYITPYKNVYINRNGALQLEDRGMEFVGWSEGITSLDYDLDGDVDILVANEEGNKVVLWENDGNGFFREVSRGLGGSEILNGSVTVGDVDNDADLDVYVSRGLYLNQDGRFSFQGPVGGMVESMFFADLDNDTDLDLVHDGIFWNDGEGNFVRNDFGVDPAIARGGMAFDYDNDGDLDLILNVSDRHKPYLRFYENELNNGNHWIQIFLEHESGQVGNPGAKIWVYKAGTLDQLGYREITTATGFVSGPSYRQHFGLGTNDRVDIKVRWITGEERILNNIHADQSIRIISGVQTFVDVPLDHWAYAEIESLYQQGYVAGCSSDPLMYCPEGTMTRGESAVFVERGIHGAGYTAPPPSSLVFADVPLNEWFAKWANGLFEDGYTAGCGTNPLVYCPLQEHTRTEGTVFFLRMLHGASYVPPDPAGIFADVEVGYWGAKWIEAAYTAGLIPACETSPELRFCPDDPLDRAMAAYMMVQAKGLSIP